MNHEPEQDEVRLRTSWSPVGTIRQGTGNRLLFPDTTPILPGAYLISAVDRNEAYVGEGQNLRRRLADYVNAGWMPNRKAATNRRIQGWIIECLTSGSAVELSVCVEAEILEPDGTIRRLDLSHPYHRYLLEGLTIARQPGVTFRNL